MRRRARRASTAPLTTNGSTAEVCASPGSYVVFDQLHPSRGWGCVVLLRHGSLVWVEGGVSCREWCDGWGLGKFGIVLACPATAQPDAAAAGNVAYPVHVRVDFGGDRNSRSPVGRGIRNTEMSLQTEISRRL